MLAELHEHHRAQPLLGQARRKERDRLRDVAAGAQAAKAAGDCGRRQSHARRERFRSLGVVTLDLVQQRYVEAVEHVREAAKFWHPVHQKCAQLPPPFAENWHVPRRICAKREEHQA